MLENLASSLGGKTPVGIHVLCNVKNAVGRIKQLSTVEHLHISTRPRRYKEKLGSASTTISRYHRGCPHKPVSKNLVP